jgi:hypothetical protein
MQRDLLQKEHGSMPDSWEFINDTATHLGRWNGIMLSSDSPAVFTTLTLADGTDFTTASAYLPRDMMIPAFIKEVQLSSGVLFLAKS